jgi:hypothetical protein
MKLEHGHRHERSVAIRQDTVFTIANMCQPITLTSTSRTRKQSVHEEVQCPVVDNHTWLDAHHKCKVVVFYQRNVCIIHIKVACLVFASNVKHSIIVHIH